MLWAHILRSPNGEPNKRLPCSISFPTDRTEGQRAVKNRAAHIQFIPRLSLSLTDELHFNIVGRDVLRQHKMLPSITELSMIRRGCVDTCRQSTCDMYGQSRGALIGGRGTGSRKFNEERRMRIHPA